MDQINKIAPSEHLFLRELEQKDWEDVHAYASQEKVCHYQPWGPNSVAETQSFVNQVLKDAAEIPRSRYVFAVENQGNNHVIGAGEVNIRDRTNRVGEIAYIINPAYWGRGYATDVAVRLVEFSLAELELHRIYATCDPRNSRSARVLEKVGMIREGRIREDVLLREGWRDSLLYSLLDYEWENAKEGEMLR
ncbi:GNAT family N-acetyltransferase [Thalassobacillus sp. CUG 92003]|uniref:GNAT family N-acetyltransferase n=1 Tax=Thalassobacillus sp. CUG 92003 TaxID=2736641 RepID=UPI0015E6F13C|nr:GNAT family protein [Thalassobacillus sp. CUG 92003]